MTGMTVGFVGVGRMGSRLTKTQGEKLGVPLFVSTGAFQVLQMAKRMDLGARDVSALGRLYEQMLGVTLRAEVER